MRTATTVGMLLASVALAVTWGLNGFGPAGAQTTAQPTPPAGWVVPRYTYGPGYYGYGYYLYSSPTAASPPASAYPTYSSPRGYSRRGDTVGPGHRDWTAGRDLPLAKPWLRPMD